MPLEFALQAFFFNISIITSYVGITVPTYVNVLYSKQLQNRHIDIILTLVVATNEYDQNIGWCYFIDDFIDYKRLLFAWNSVKLKKKNFIKNLDKVFFNGWNNISLKYVSIKVMPINLYKHIPSS